MPEPIYKSLAVSLAALVLMPGVFSMILSTLGSIYFISMIKINVVDKKYNGNWGRYLKSWFYWFLK